MQFSNRIVSALFCLFCAHLSLTAQGQAPTVVQEHVNRMMPKPVPASPNVASLGKFGDYQVSMFSGVPEISIPLYEVESGDIKLPITLSYHASGVKPTDLASWVGMGWSLSTGGQISRSIQGKPDEQGYSTTALNSNLSVCSTFFYLLYSARKVTDTEPDIFNYSFPGKSGKFLWTYNSTPYFVPYAPMKLTSNPGLGSFELTDESGLIYRFGQNGRTETTTATNGGNPAFSAVTAWHLGEIVSPNSDDGVVIDHQQIGTFNTHDISYSYTLMDECQTFNAATCPQNSFIAQQHNNDSYGTQTGPETITFDRGKVRFFLGANRSDAPALKYLDRIEVQDLSGNIVKSIKFFYSYFTNAIGGNAALKLDSIQFKDNASAVVNQFEFKYFTNSFSWNPNNTNFYNARDLWGYYNGATNNTDLILPRIVPYQELVSSSIVNWPIGGAANREVDTTYVKQGVLKQITFPTGGSTTFDFESNKYLNNGTPRLAGGLRVKKITSTAGPNTHPIVKTYKYGLNESGYGSPNFSDMQFNYSSQIVTINDPCGMATPAVNFKTRTFFSNSAFNYDSFDASPISYTSVTEYIENAAGMSNGKTVFEYDNGNTISDIEYLDANAGKYYRNSLFWKRGKLTKKVVYDVNGNKLSESNTAYTLYKDEQKFIGVGAHQVYAPYDAPLCAPNFCLNESNDRVFANALSFRLYYQNSGAFLETSNTEQTFQSGTPANVVTHASSVTHHPDKIQVIESRTTHGGHNKVVVNRYPFQLDASVNSSSTGTAEGIYMLNQKNILTTPIETYTYLSNGTTDRITSAQVTAFRKNTSNINQVVPDKIYVLEAATTIPKTSYIPLAINGGNNGIVVDTNLKQRISFLNYDEKGSVTAATKVNDAPVSYAYGYKKTLPVVEAKNATNGQYQSIQNGVVSITLSGPTSGTIQGSYNFTVDYVGTVQLKLGVSGNPSYNTVATYSGITGGSATLTKGGCGLTVITFNNVSPGNYTVVVTLTTPDTGVSSLGACGEITYPKNQSVLTGTSEFLYESFEESTATGVVTGPLVPHSGKKYFNGDFTVTYTMPNTRNYIIEYSYYDNTVSKWKPMSKTYTGTSMVLNEGSAIDNVRIRPSDSAITTYTYEPLWGMTSVTDNNNITTYYEYDSFGRLRLTKDYLGNILTLYDYHYKQ